MIFLLLFLAQNVVTNPIGDQLVSQPPSTLLSITRFRAINSITIPTGLISPIGNCRNGSLYLNQSNLLLRCIQGKWTGELRPHSDKFLGNQTITISQSSYIPESLEVFRNGLLQDSEDFSISGLKINFKLSLDSLDKINLRYLATN